MAGIQFSILEVAVAPVVLGLGIDYSIHLQRRYNTFRAEGKTASVAWLRGFETLKVPLGLAVITTMAAFIANIVSPPSAAHFRVCIGLRCVLCFCLIDIVGGSSTCCNGARFRGLCKAH